MWKAEEGRKSKYREIKVYDGRGERMEGTGKERRENITARCEVKVDRKVGRRKTQ